MSKVLVLEANGRNVVSVVRSFGRQGIYVVCAEDSPIALSFFSKYCNKKLVYPSPKKKPQEWLDWLLNVLKDGSFDMVMPIGDVCYEIISRNRELISKYTKVVVSDYDIWSKGRNKATTLKIAKELDLPIPETYFISELSQVKQIEDKMKYPVVIKPQVSSGSRGIVYVNKKEQLFDMYAKVHKTHKFPVIQEYIPSGGNAYGVFLLFDQNCEPRAVFVHKRLREFPVKGGPSTLRESVRRPDLVDISIKLLKSMNWFGVAMVEFKEDPRDGICKIMEINPRLWGSLPLSIAAGVDFPYLMYRMAMDGNIEPVFNYPEGIRCRWLLLGDILHFLTNPKRFSMNPSFFNFSENNRRDDFISLKDFGPTLGFFIIALRDLFKLERWKHVFFRSGA